MLPTAPTGQALPGLVEAEDGLIVTDPATGTELARVGDVDAGAALVATEASAAALPAWAATPPRVRSEVLHRAFGLMSARADYFAALIAAESGKSGADARAEVGYAAEFLRWFAEEAVRPAGHFGTASDGASWTAIAPQPVGVALLITPWNFPAAMITRKVAPALAAGCTCVVKPAAETPLTALALAALLREAGVPADAVAVLPTTGPGAVADAVLGHRAVRKLSFTGSTEVGRHLLRRCADRVVNCSMELGGNAPFVVTAGADVDAAVRGALHAKLRNTGQACTAANRFFVHRDVADRFTEAFAAAVAARRFGEEGDLGPLIHARAVRRVGDLVDAAVDRGARVVTAPVPVPERGSFYAPRVLADVAPESALLEQEIFGPVAPIVTWTDIDRMVQAVNAGEFGLAGYVWAADTGEGARIARRLQCGMVAVNRSSVSDPATPFGGMKQSGLGREGGHEGVRAFQEQQFLSLDNAV